MRPINSRLSRLDRVIPALGARFFRALRDYCADLGILMQQGRTAEPTEEELSLLSEPLLESLPAYRGVVVANDSQSSAATDIEGEIARA